MGKHEAKGHASRTGPIGQLTLKTAKHVVHPIVHVVAIIGLHTAALTIMTKTPILHLIGLTH